MIAVAVVDDDAMLVDGVRTWLADHEDMRLVGTASTVDALLYADTGCRRTTGVALLDLFLRDYSDPAVNVRRLVQAGWRVLVVSVWSQPRQVAATFAVGAQGYLTKDRGLSALGEAIRHVAAGETVYSPELAYALLRDPRPASGWTPRTRTSSGSRPSTSSSGGPPTPSLTWPTAYARTA